MQVWAPDQPPLRVLQTWMGPVFSTSCCRSAWRCGFLPPAALAVAFLAILFGWHPGWHSGAAMLAAAYGTCSLWHRRCSSRTENSGATSQPQAQRCRAGVGHPRWHSHARPGTLSGAGRGPGRCGGPALPESPLSSASGTTADTRGGNWASEEASPGVLRVRPPGCGVSSPMAGAGPAALGIEVHSQIHPL